MSDRDWHSMDEREFETMLENSVPELPPDDVVTEVTPWKKATNRVLAGMALCAITLNFLCLDYILPAIGMVLALLGFRALRRENGWFRACFLMAAVRAAYCFAVLVLNAFIARSAVLALPVFSALSAAGPLLLLAECFCLWRGFRAVQRKAGFPPRAGSLIALMIWYALVCLLGLLQYQGLVMGVIMLAAYILVIRGIYKLAQAMDEAGYAVRAAPVRIPDRRAAQIIAAVLAVGILCGYLFGGSYPMDWEAVSPSEHVPVEETKARLAELGFPETVLDDLTPEDIAACDGALQVVVDVTDTEVDGSETELRCTGVAVRVPGQRESWVIFHHFLWLADPGFYGTESIQLWPVYRDIPEGWAAAGEVTGRVLYDRDGETFAAPYYSLSSETFTYDSLFWDRQTSTDVFANFSMPRKGENCRGYLAYPMAVVQEGYIIDSWINYTHQTSWLQYPVLTAMENRMRNSLNKSMTFITIQDALQFFAAEDGIRQFSQ